MTRALLFAAVWCCACTRTPPPQPVSLRVTSLNLANGAGDRYRLADVRSRQTGFLAGVNLAALQEVDVNVLRSGGRNTALDAAGLPGCAFAVAEAPHLTADGVLQCSSDAGVLLFGVGFRGDDVYAVDDAGVPLGIPDFDDSLDPWSTDRGHDALYGNALLVRGVGVESAVVIALPIDPAAQQLDAWSSLASAPVEARAAHNLTIRSTPGIEPRSVLVVRLARPAAPTLSVLATHFESGSYTEIRTLQLRATLRVAAAERAMGRSVMVIGDLNMVVSDAATHLNDAGFALASGEGPDQLWVAALTVSDAAARPTDGASDHAFAPEATVR